MRFITNVTLYGINQVVVLLTFLVAYCFLEDWTVVDTNDTDDDDDYIQQNSSIDVDGTSETEVEENNNDNVEDFIGMIPAKSMVKPYRLRRWFPNQYQSMHVDCEGQQQDGNGLRPATRSLPNYNIYRTQYTRNNDNSTSICAVRLTYCLVSFSLHGTSIIILIF